MNNKSLTRWEKSVKFLSINTFNQRVRIFTNYCAEINAEGINRLLSLETIETCSIFAATFATDGRISRRGPEGNFGRFS